MAGLPDAGAAGRSGPGRNDSNGNRYRVVTVYRAPGERCSLPERARDVSVDALPNGAGVRITYLTPLREVPFRSPEPSRSIN